MSDHRHDLERIDLSLTAIEYVSDVKAQSIDGEFISGGKASSRAPQSGGQSAYDELRGEVKRLADKCERTLQQSRKREAQEMTPGQRNYWIIHHDEGRRLRDVAERHGVTEATVSALRELHGREPERGRIRQRAKGAGRPRNKREAPAQDGV